MTATAGLGNGTGPADDGGAGRGVRSWAGGSKHHACTHSRTPCRRLGLKAAGALSLLPPLLTRLVIGYAFYQTGRGKLANPEQIVAFFTDLGIPFPGANAAFVSRLEFYGGMLLIAGLLTRLVALGLGSTMVVALMTADKDAFLDALMGTSDADLTGCGPGRVRAVPAVADRLRARPRSAWTRSCDDGCGRRRSSDTLPADSPTAHQEKVERSLSSLIASADGGDRSASDALFATLYAELHRLASRQLARSSGALTLGTTTLLHEAYLNMSRREGTSFPDRARFMGYAARVMRGLVIDYVRNRNAQKRGGLFEIASLVGDLAAAAQDGEQLGRIGLALDELATVDPALAQVVDLKFFCGFSLGEIAGHERGVRADRPAAVGEGPHPAARPDPGLIPCRFRPPVSDLPGVEPRARGETGRPSLRTRP